VESIPHAPLKPEMSGPRGADRLPTGLQRSWNVVGAGVRVFSYFSRSHVMCYVYRDCFTKSFYIMEEGDALYPLARTSS
jgi:hypothetical protein